MKRPLLESEKNYIKCAVLMIICGIVFLAMGSGLGGGICISLGVFFAIATVYMYRTTDPEAMKEAASKQINRSSKKK